MGLIDVLLWILAIGCVVIIGEVIARAVLEVHRDLGEVDEQWERTRRERRQMWKERR